MMIRAEHRNHALPRVLARAACVLLLSACSLVTASARNLKAPFPPLQFNFSRFPAMTPLTAAPIGNLLNPEPTTTLVYASGLTEGWRQASYGCSDCNFQDMARRRSLSTASIYADIMPWGAVVLQSTTPFSGNSVLDLWVMGAHITRTTLSVEDSTGTRASRKLQFSFLNGTQAERGLNVLETDDSGWIHMQISLRELTSGMAWSMPSLLDTTPWSSIVLKDISGSGFRIQLDAISLLSMGLSSPIKISDFSNPINASMLFKLPVLNFEAPPQELAPGLRYIMKLKPNAQFSQLQSICKELDGAILGGQTAPRFRGACDGLSPSLSLQPLTPGTAGISDLAWRFQPFTAKSQVDLDNMRRLLGSSIEYFERDLIVTLDQTRIPSIVKHQKRVDTSTASQTAESADATSAPADAPTNARTETSPSSTQRQANIKVRGKGVRSTEPETCLCTMIWAPVCANSATYSSRCVAMCAGLQPPFTPGECDSHTSPPPAMPEAPLPPAPPPPVYSSTGGAPAPSGNSTDGGAIDAAACFNPGNWGNDRIDQLNLPLDGAYCPGDLDGSGVHVYVLDTGVRWSHTDFAGRVGEGANFVGGNSIWDDNGHGTHVAGTVLGANHGVARNAILHPIKVMAADGSGSYSNIISAMGWVKNHVRNNGYTRAVVSMSIGGPRAASLNDAVADLTNSNIPVIIAAGNNNGGDSCAYSPASAPSGITVGASTRSDSLASFSNIGSCIFMFAPGDSITSASYTGDSAQSTMSGTSMATPHVTGAVAMLLQAFPGASVDSIKQRLANAAAGRTFSTSSASRLLNAQSDRLRGGSAPAPAPTPFTAAPSVPVTSRPVTVAPSLPTTTFPSFPSFGIPTRPSWCSGCSWCMFCS